MIRKDLKKKAKGVLKKNYFKCILVAFIVGLVVNTGYTYTSNNIKTTDNKVSNAESVHTDKESNYDTMEKFFKDLDIDITLKSDSKAAKGLAAPIVNKVTEGKSSIIYLLNFIDLAFFKKNMGGAIVSLIATIIVILFYFFIQNIIVIGDSRFFLETRRYSKTKLERILFPYKSKRIFHLAFVTFIKELKLFLWFFTIIGIFIKYYEYSMIPYVLAENPNISRKDAFRLSKELTKGYKWELFKLDLSLIGWEILSAFTLGLSSLLFTDAYKRCIYAEFYMKTRSEHKKEFKDLLIDDNLDIKEAKDEEYPMTVSEKKKEMKRDYNKKYSFTTYILFFFTFAFVGWLYEVAIHLVKDGVFVNRGTMYGPWLPIYGFGIVFILFLLRPFRNNYVKFFIATVLLCGVLEYAASWYLETFKGMKWWDYSGYFLNINGRVCFEGLLVFGLGGCAVTYLVAPILDQLYAKIAPKIRIIICVVLVMFFGVDFAYSSFHPNAGKGITDYE